MLKDGDNGTKLGDFFRLVYVKMFQKYLHHFPSMNDGASLAHNAISTPLKQKCIMKPGTSIGCPGANVKQPSWH